ncbi:hypothetical protein [Ferruginibacter sp. HRS2-29]|uniref:hypothetical protein n=1 Tax=Ferruginibacter sp. HRS2-29 TaxID=2487334 RepID=UPI0020CDE7D4|nr:hypothetical protein [Ferruginibacter sp. HRS2-29]MCP9753520.1 hypothetical protein [Ferruginibacter sp. HRS2-29]
MKKAIYLAAFFIMALTIRTAAQSSSPKADELLNQLKQKTGSFTVTASNGRKVSGKAILLKLGNNKGFVITCELIESKVVQILSLKIPKAAAGKYPLEKNDNLVTIDGITYEIREGEITVQLTGGKLSGKFSGNIYSINKRKSKFDVPAGKADGTFTGLTKQ